MKRWACLVAIGAVALTGTAAAATATPRLLFHVRPWFPSPLRLAESVASSYWGGMPCGGHVTIRYAPASSAPSDDTSGVTNIRMWAWTTFDTPSGPMAFSQSPAYTDCVVTVVNYFSTIVQQSAGFAQFCPLIVHEFGHLYGHPDINEDRGSIMYPAIGPANDRLPGCMAAYRFTRYARFNRY